MPTVPRVITTLATLATTVTTIMIVVSGATARGLAPGGAGARVAEPAASGVAREPGIGPAAESGDPCSACPCPADIDRDDQVGFAEVLMIVADWGACPSAARDSGASTDPGDAAGDPCLACPCPPDVNRDGWIGQADLLAVLVTWGACTIENDCTEPGVCPNFIFGCNGDPDCTCVELFDGTIACQREWTCGDECPDGVCPPGFHCVRNSCCGETSCAPDSALCAPVGACCVGDLCVDPLTENACLSMGGLFLGLGTDCRDADCGRGACCRLDAACAETVESICATQGGTFLGEGSDCAACVGPCCLVDTSCIGPVSVPACNVAGGIFQGFGLECGDIECPAGACCLLDAQCEIASEEGCAGLGGVFQGEDTTCADCGFGACCLDDGVCRQTIESVCVELGGVFQGVATECFFCTIGACCLFDGTCVHADETICAAEGGAFQGALVYCPDVECPQRAACCFVQEPCADLTEDDCGSAGGLFNPLALCSEQQCPELGACCINGQFCRNALTEDRCVEINGEFFGAGTVCESEDCTIVQIGACCLNGEKFCIDGLTEAQCLTLGGYYPGDGTMCIDAPCD